MLVENENIKYNVFWYKIYSFFNLGGGTDGLW